MKRSRLLVCSVLCGLVLALAGSAGGGVGAQGPGPQATLGTAFTYQGRLEDGDSPANGTYDLQFSLHTAAGGGVQVGSTLTKEDVAVDDGLFAVRLDFGAGAFGGDARYLEVAVRPGSSTGSYTVLSPRQSLTAAPYALHAMGAPWSGLSGVPAGFADGTDADILSALSCSNGQLAKWDGSNWVCGNDASGTSYTAGTGLTLSGAEFRISTPYRMPQTCSSGQVAKWDNATGQWACGNDANTTYSAGTGLSLVGTTFSVNTGAIQQRVTEACGAGYAIRQVNANGSVVCEADDDTTYTAGTGLTLAGTEFDVNFGGSGSNNTVARSDHGHLGQTWVGSDNSLVITGTYGAPYTAPLVLGNGYGDGLLIGVAGASGVVLDSAGVDGVVVRSAGATGVAVDSAGGDGVVVGAAGATGMVVGSADYGGVLVGEAGNPSAKTCSAESNGFEVCGAEGHGLFVGRADDEGIRVESAGGNGVYVSSAYYTGVYVKSAGSAGVAVGAAGDSGVYVSSAGGNGLEVNSAGGSGVFVRSADYDGVYVISAGDPSFSMATCSNRHNGFEVCAAEGDGLFIGRVDSSGVHVDEVGNPSMHTCSIGHAGFEVCGAEGNGLYIGHSNQTGIVVDSAGDHGLYIGSTVNDGLRVNSAGRDGVAVVSAGASGVYVASADLDGVHVHQAGRDAGYFNGDVVVTGNLSKGGGSFKIDHPLDPETKYLSHSFVESPDMMNVYNGNVTLDVNGEAWVEMPEWFEALNCDFRYQLTPIGGPGPNLYIAREVQDNRFQIAGGTPGLKVSWQVTGIRQDPYANANRMPVEEDKPPEERGTYLHPKAYDLPETRGLAYKKAQEYEAGREQP